MESTVTSMLADIEIELESSDIEDCHQIGKPDKANSKKTLFALQIEYIAKQHWSIEKNPEQMC